jgi:hypothetical protein
MELLIEKVLKRGVPTIEETSGLGSLGEDPLYYCATIGEDLHEQRYHVVRKLGWGSHASVWLAQDRKLVRHSLR